MKEVGNKNIMQREKNKENNRNYSLVFITLNVNRLKFLIKGNKSSEIGYITTCYEKENHTYS